MYIYIYIGDYRNPFKILYISWISKLFIHAAKYREFTGSRQRNQMVSTLVVMKVVLKL